MGISILPNVGADIGQNLAVLGQAIAQLVNPNAATQRAVQQLIATDPTALPRMAAAMRNVPIEKLQKMAGKGTAALLSAQPKSAEEILGGIDVDLFRGIAEDPDELSRFKEGRKAQALSTSVREMRTVDLGSTAENLKNLLALDVLPIEARASVERARADILRSQPVAQAETDTARLRSELATRAADFVRIAPDAWRRSLQALEPGFFTDERLQTEFENSLLLIKARSAADFDEYEENLYKGLARSWALKAGGKPEAYIRYFKDEHGKASQLLADPTKAVTPEDKELLDVARRVNRGTDAKEITNLAFKTGVDIRLLEDRFADATIDIARGALTREEGESRMNNVIKSINANISLLNNSRVNAGLTPLDIKAGLKVEERFFGRDRRTVRYTDAAGNEYTPDQLQQLMAGAGTVPGGGGALEQQALDNIKQIQESGGDLQGYLDALRSQNPQLFGSMTTKGLIP